MNIYVCDILFPGLYGQMPEKYVHLDVSEAPNVRAPNLDFTLKPVLLTLFLM